MTTPAKPTMDSVMQDIGNQVDRAVETGVVNDPAQSTGGTPQADQPAERAAGATGSSATTQEPRAAPPVEQPRFVTVNQFDNFAQTMTSFAQEVARGNNLLQQQIARQDPRQQEAPRKRPSALEVSRSFVPPARTAGESDEAYGVRVQAEVLDKVIHANSADVEARAQEIANNAVAQYARAVEEQRVAQQGQHQFESAVDDAVRSAGLDPVTEAGKFVREYARQGVLAMAATGQMQGWGPQHIRQQLVNNVNAIKSRIAVPPGPGQQTQLSVVQGGQQNQQQRQAPIGGAGGGGGGAVPPSGNSYAAPAKNIEEAMERVRLGMVAAVKNGRV